MRMLALDASLRRCSAALLDGAECLGRRDGGDSRAAASALPGMVQALLAAHGGRVDVVGVTVGPGSFTGLRAACAFAHGLALGGGIPVIGVTVAEALLEAVGGPAWVALDSRRAGRIYLCRDVEVAVLPLDGLPWPAGPALVVGDAAESVAATLRAMGADAVAGGGEAIDPVLVGRVALRRLRGELPPCAAQPLYVEAPEARPAAGLRPAPA